jgi:ParB family transcriptional regulator, chromosome partitioning protein
MSKPRGLGRGLGALFPGAGAGAAAGAHAAREALVSIDLKDIAPNPDQPRRGFDNGALEALAQSIRANGLLAPIIVRPKSDGATNYQIVIGERRWRAARLAGMRSINAFVRDARDGQALELALLENVQRSDLNAIEEAAGYRQLIGEHRFTQDSLAQRIGKSRPAIANALRLLNLPDSVQAMVRDGKLSAGHARALAALPGPKAEKLARTAIARGWNVRDIERAAGATSGKHAAKRVPAPRSQLPPDLMEIEDRLRFALATRVALRRASKGGSIEIQYADDEELQRIVDRICPEVP